MRSLGAYMLGAALYVTRGTVAFYAAMLALQYAGGYMR